MRSRIILFVCGLLCSVLFLMNMDICKQLFLDGFLICARSLVPSMLPFIIASNMILTSINDLPLKFRIPIIYALGLTFGFPISVKYASEMLKKNEIGYSTYKKLVCCGGVPSFGFTIGVCGKHFGIEKGVILYMITVISALLCSSYSEKDLTVKADAYNTKKDNKHSFFSVISESIRDGTYRMINICGYVIFFYTLSGILCSGTNDPYAVAIISGFLEFSTGCTRALSITSNVSYVMCAAILSFSGMSVFMQCASTEKEYGVKVLKVEYLLSRTAQALLSSIMAYCVLLGYVFIIPFLIFCTAICLLTPFLQRIHKNKLNRTSKSSIISH